MFMATGLFLPLLTQVFTSLKDKRISLMAEDNQDFPSAHNTKYFVCIYLCILYICPQFSLLNRKDQIFKGIRHVAKYFEVIYENSPHFPPLSLSIYTDLGGLKGQFL